MNELVSVVVPVYNMGDSLEKSIQSIQRQDYKDIEIILVDDGSQDNSYEICCKLKENDARIIVYHTENRGSGPARNYGIAHANGRFIYFPDADDYLSPNAIKSMVTAAEMGKYDLVIFGYSVLNQAGTQIRTKQFPDAVRFGQEIRLDYSDCMGTSSVFRIQGASWNKLFDLNLIRKHSISYPSLRRHQDEGFIAKYMCYSENIRFISDVLYSHCENDLKKEWVKFPVDYIDAAIGLFEERKKNILIWSETDTKTHDMVYKEYIRNVIKALELSFSPKFGFDTKHRLMWQKGTISKSRVTDIPIPVITGRYQKSIIRLIKKRKYNLCYIIMLVKVSLQRIGAADVVKNGLCQSILARLFR